MKTFTKICSIVIPVYSGIKNTQERKDFYYHMVSKGIQNSINLKNKTK
jgi:hypothetical protein